MGDYKYSPDPPFEHGSVQRLDLSYEDLAQLCDRLSDVIDSWLKSRGLTDAQADIIIDHADHIAIELGVFSNEPAHSVWCEVGTPDAKCPVCNPTGATALVALEPKKETL